MKHQIYFSGMIIPALMITSFGACNKESISNSSNAGYRNITVTTTPVSITLPANHWYLIQGNTYVTNFIRILAPHGMIKKVLDAYLSNKDRQELQNIGEVPTKCLGGKIWYKIDGPDFKVFFIPDEGTPPPSVLYIKMYYY